MQQTGPEHFVFLPWLCCRHRPLHLHAQVACVAAALRNRYRRCRRRHIDIHADADEDLAGMWHARKAQHPVSQTPSVMDCGFKAHVVPAGMSQMRDLCSPERLSD